MKMDIIGSKFSRKLTEFKNFKYEVNNIVEGQSFLSLLSSPYETTMKELNTTDLSDITVAYRDLNKLLYPELLKSKSETLMIDLLSELNEIVEYNNSFYNASSFELLDIDFTTKKLANIQKFRAIYAQLDEIINLINQYDKVIFLKILPKEENDQLFIEGLYKLLEEKIEQKLTLTVDNSELDLNLNAPIEIYNQVNQDLKKFSSDNYYNQLLFDESLEENILSVYINYVEKREYVYELYKDGKPFKKSNPTTARYYEYQLHESGNYRIRVIVTDGSVNPRFSQTYYFTTDYSKVISSEPSNYIEIPENKNMWMLDIILESKKYEGLVGNAYQYPTGYHSYPVYLEEEIDQQFLTKEKLLPLSLNIISEMPDDKFNSFINQHAEQLKNTSPLYIDFLDFLQNKSS